MGHRRPGGDARLPGLGAAIVGNRGKRSGDSRSNPKAQIKACIPANLALYIGLYEVVGTIYRGLLIAVHFRCEPVVYKFEIARAFMVEGKEVDVRRSGLVFGTAHIWDGRRR